MSATLSPARALARHLLPPGLRHDLATRIIEHRVARSPDRHFLRRAVIPALATPGCRLLMVGCRRYNAGDAALAESCGATCWSIDIDPACARWGVPGRHRVAAVQDLPFLFRTASFDAVLLNGVFGFGVNEAEQQRVALAACAIVLAPRGRLVLGWNTDRTADPAGLCASWFVPCTISSLAPRHAVAGTTHVFDALCKIT